MISKDERLLSPAIAARAFRHCSTIEDMKELHALIKGRALRDLDPTEDNSNWVKLYLEYCIGKPRVSQLHLPKVELGDVTTLEGVKEAIQRILEAQATGLLSDDEAESYRKTLDRALAALRTAAAQQQADALGEGATIFYGSASAEPAQDAENYREHLEAMKREEALDN